MRVGESDSDKSAGASPTPTYVIRARFGVLGRREATGALAAGRSPPRLDPSSVGTCTGSAAELEGARSPHRPCEAAIATLLRIGGLTSSQPRALPLLVRSYRLVGDRDPQGSRASACSIPPVVQMRALSGIPTIATGPVQAVTSTFPTSSKGAAFLRRLSHLRRRSRAGFVRISAEICSPADESRMLTPWLAWLPLRLGIG
jgi:hypothetical protein